MWIFPSLVVAGEKKLEDFRDVFDNESEHSQLLDNLKQIGFYTDCLGKAHWSIPAEVIDKETTTQMIKIAKTQCKKRDFTEREIELWIKHLKPVWRGSMDSMKIAMNNWFEDMKKEQLVTEHELSFKTFIGE
jgi:hypothetical protein